MIRYTDMSQRRIFWIFNLYFEFCFLEHYLGTIFNYKIISPQFLYFAFYSVLSIVQCTGKCFLDLELNSFWENKITQLMFRKSSNNNYCNSSWNNIFISAGIANFTCLKMRDHYKSKNANINRKNCQKDYFRAKGTSMLKNCIIQKKILSFENFCLKCILIIR